MTYAVGTDGLTLVAVDAAAVSDGSVSVPVSVAYAGTAYPVTAVGPYAFYLSGATDVALPASIDSVDDRAFRSSDVEWVEVDPGNPNYASFDGAIYSAGQLRLLLIPGGRQGAVRIPDKAEEVDARAFSHCAGVDAISADAGSAHFASWDGLLYDAFGTTLLRVPAGAAEITIRDGCTTIAAGALEGCASLERIGAPASVASISPDVFTSVPTVSLPIASTVVGSDVATSSDYAFAQLSALVALSSSDIDFPGVASSDITVALPEGAGTTCWGSRGFTVVMQPVLSALDTRTVLSASSGLTIVANGGSFSNPSFAAPLQSWWAQIGSVSLSPSGFHSSYYNGDFVLSNPGCTFAHWSWVSDSSGTGGGYIEIPDISSPPYPCYWAIWRVPLTWNPNGGYWNSDPQKTDSLTSTHVSNNKATGYKGATIPTRSGYTFIGWGASPSSLSATLSVSPLTKQTYYAQWRPNPYAVSFDSQGGPAVSSISATYDADVTLPAPGVRNGYAFQGWNTEPDGSGTLYQANASLAKPNLATSGTVTLYAQWKAVVEAEVPLEVTAGVDVLGLEEPREGQGYIESRCGEPLVVTGISFAPLAGAVELFGDRAGEVLLEVLPRSSSSPAARFLLDAGAAESDASKLAAFFMSAYGDRIPISYRLAMPLDVQTALAEFADPKPICQVSYTVALA